MELRVLRYYLTIAREENITRAAEILHITQPTLSRQMAELEAELNTRLFERTNRKIALTEAGIFYLPEHSGRGTETEYILISSSMRCIILNSAQITSKVTRSSSGAVVFTLKKGQKVQSAEIFKDDGSEAMKIYSKYRKVKLPSAGTTFNNSEQSTLF